MKQLLKSFISGDNIHKILCGAILLGAMTATPAQAVVISAESQGFGVEVGLSAGVAPVVLATLDVGPLPVASGVAAPPYDETASVLDVSASADVVNLAVGQYELGAISGTLAATATSDVDGLPGFRTTDATATVEDLDLAISTLTPLLGPVASLVTLTATLIDSVAEVSGDFGALAVFGDSTLLGLEVTVAGIVIDLVGEGAIDAQGKAAPNTVLGAFGLDILGVLGLTIILNEQIVGGDGLTSAEITVNAIRIALDDVASGLVGVGLISGEVIIAQSYAQMSAVSQPDTGAIPEPNMALCLGGLFGLFAIRGALRRRRQAA